jgi:hypothetical protein
LPGHQGSKFSFVIILKVRSSPQRTLCLKWDHL